MTEEECVRTDVCCQGRGPGGMQRSEPPSGVAEGMEILSYRNRLKGLASRGQKKRGLVGVPSHEYFWEAKVIVGELGAKSHSNSKGMNMLVGNWEVEFLGRMWGSSKAKEKLRRGWKGHNCYLPAVLVCTALNQCYAAQLPSLLSY